MTTDSFLLTISIITVSRRSLLTVVMEELFLMILSVPVVRPLTIIFMTTTVVMANISVKSVAKPSKLVKLLKGLWFLRALTALILWFLRRIVSILGFISVPIKSVVTTYQISEGYLKTWFLRININTSFTIFIVNLLWTF